MTAVDVASLIAAQRTLDSRVIDLARALSIGTRIEGALVRHMRLALFPESDAGLEANLWFSTLVADRDILGLALIPQCRDELRRQLTLPEHRKTLEQAWQVIVSCHQPQDAAGLPPVINVQETVTYHAIAGAAFGSSAHVESMQRAFGMLINGLEHDSDGSLVQWIARAVPTLPAAARQSAPAIALAEKVRERDATIVLEGVPRVARDGTASVGNWAGKTIDVGCRRRTDGIEFSVPPAIDSHILRVPDTSPLTVDVRSPAPEGWHTRSINFEPVRVHVIPDPTPASCCVLTSAIGHRLTIQPLLDEKTPTLEVLDPRVADVPEQAELAATVTENCKELGWNVRWPSAGIPSSGDPPSAVLFLGEAGEFIGRTIPNVPVIAWTPDRLEPIGGLQPIVTTYEHGSNVLSAEYSRDGARIATSGDLEVQVWDAASGQVLVAHPLDQPSRAATFSPDGARLLIASNDGTISSWLFNAGASSPFGHHDDWVMSAEFSASGRYAVTASQDQTAAVWDANTGVKSAVLRHSAPVNYASLSVDESKVATASDDDTAVIWTRDGRKLATLEHDAEVRSIQWSPDGQWLLTADAAGDAWLWNAATFERDHRPFHHDSELHFATFSPDSRRLAVATGDGTVWIWHVASRALMGPGLRAPDPVPDQPPRKAAKMRPRSPRQAVHSVAFSPDGSQLLSGGASGRAHVWNIATSERIAPSWDQAQQRSLRSLGSTVPTSRPATVAEAIRGELLALDEQRLLSWIASTSHGSAAQTAATVEEPNAPNQEAEENFGGEDGAHALIAFIDDGIDVLHETFLDAHGRSRIVGIWDQRNPSDPPGPPPPGFDFGRLHTADDIARYVAEKKTPAELGPTQQRQGTGVASIAAGRRIGSFAGGIAPAASILVVIRSGDFDRFTSDHGAALSYIDRAASELRLPAVVCIGSGLNHGAHDGTSPLELMLEEFSKGGRQPGRIVVKSSGNERNRHSHAQLTVPTGAAERLIWKCPPQPLKSRLELWWPSSNQYRFQLKSPSGEVSELAEPNHPDVEGYFKRRGSYAMKLIARHPDNGDSMLEIETNIGVVSASAQDWTLDVQALKVTDTGEIHAWLERSAEPMEFVNHMSESHTLTVPATARSVIVVGAVESGLPLRMAAFSSYGPTRDGREKPDVAAPGVDLTVAKAGSSTESTVMGGTSFSAAYVSGAVALLLSQSLRAGAPAPTATQIAAALRQTTLNYTGKWDRGQGYGVVDPQRLLKAFLA